MSKDPKEDENENEDPKKDDKVTPKELELALAALDRQYGKGTVIRLGDTNIEPWPAVSTGALSLDMALGIRGLPLGRIVEIYGPESSGKSTICMSVVAQAQSQGMTCAYIDAEHAVDPLYARALGVDLDDLLFSQPTTGEEGLEIVLKLVATGAVSVIIVDSVAALVPKAELDGEMSDNHMGLQSRMMSKAMRKLVGMTNETKTLVVFTNQLREKIGIVFGNPETQPGGRALKYAASVRLDLRKASDIKAKEDGSVNGVRVKAKVVKNKMAPPLTMTEFDIVYGKGVNTIGCILDLAETKGVVRKSGAWYYYGEDMLGQGRDNAVEHLASDLELADKIKKEVMERYV